MTKTQIAEFLKNAGVEYSVGDDNSNLVLFNSRGTTLAAFAYDKGDLLHLVCRYEMPEHSPPQDLVLSTFQAIEDEFPIVKLRQSPSDSGPQFEVSAEQFEPDRTNISSVFWRTADLIVQVADECYLRLSRKKSDAPSDVMDPEAASRSAWISKIEVALQRGCDQLDSNEHQGVEAAAFSHAKASLVMVLTADGTSGSGFCVASSSEAAHYVTSAHVVAGCSEVTLYHQRPSYRKITAKVIARDESDDVDLALLQTEAGSAPALELDLNQPREESSVAVAGYPRIRLSAAEQFGELIPAVHFGTVTGVLRNGSCILHDAVSRPGNSGGPLFEPVSGKVLGVETAGWERDEECYAVGTALLAPFLASGKIAV